MNIGADIVYHNDLYFDAGDASNASLYLCAPSGTSTDVVESIIESLRAVSLWSQQPYKVVPESHKKDYATQMRFIACAQFRSRSIDLLIARYDHSKFPSDAARWSAWLVAIDTELG
jgi:hypothetical protein